MLMFLRWSRIRHRRQTSRVPTTRYEPDRAALAEILAGEPAYRVDQVWRGLYDHLLTPDEITNIPKSLRERLSEDLPEGLRSVFTSVSDDGETVKWLYQLDDGATIETVLMHYPHRSTVCVSSQAGCAMGCTFCATGQAGFTRQLQTGEIIEQTVRAARTASESGRRLSNVVFMGMGEPLANFDRVWPAVERIHGALGLSARHLTLSTVGVVPGIRRLADQDLPVSLAISLHAANDALRSSLVPLNKRYRLDVLAEACRYYLERKNRRLSFEWALIDGVNDRDIDIEQFAAYARPLRAHVNLIPLNPTGGFATRGSPLERVAAFRDGLEAAGVNATVRVNRGNEIDAACGQLAAVTKRSDLPD